MPGLNSIQVNDQNQLCASPSPRARNILSNKLAAVWGKLDCVGCF